MLKSSRSHHHTRLHRPVLTQGILTTLLSYAIAAFGTGGHRHITLGAVVAAVLTSLVRLLKDLRLDELRAPDTFRVEILAACNILKPQILHTTCTPTSPCGKERMATDGIENNLMAKYYEMKENI